MYDIAALITVIETRRTYLTALRELESKKTNTQRDL